MALSSIRSYFEGRRPERLQSPEHSQYACYPASKAWRMPPRLRMTREYPWNENRLRNDAVKWLRQSCIRLNADMVSDREFFACIAIHFGERKHGRKDRNCRVGEQ